MAVESWPFASQMPAQARDWNFTIHLMSNQHLAHVFIVKSAINKVAKSGLGTLPAFTRYVPVKKPPHRVAFANAAELSS
jgi:hypothetical protein